MVEETEEEKVATPSEEQVESKGRGRHTIGKERMVLDSFSIQPSNLELLRKAAEELLGESGKPIGKSALVREGVEYVLRKHGYIRGDDGGETESSVEQGGGS